MSPPDLALLRSFNSKKSEYTRVQKLKKPQHSFTQLLILWGLCKRHSNEETLLSILSNARASDTIESRAESAVDDCGLKNTPMGRALREVVSER